MMGRACIQPFDMDLFPPCGNGTVVIAPCV